MASSTTADTDAGAVGMPRLESRLLEMMEQLMLNQKKLEEDKRMLKDELRAGRSSGGGVAGVGGQESVSNEVPGLGGVTTAGVDGSMDGLAHQQRSSSRTSTTTPEEVAHDSYSRQLQQRTQPQRLLE